MKEVFGYISAWVIGALMFFGLAYGSYQMYAYLAPKYRQVDNEVFKNSEQYNNGMIRDLENLQMEYINADKDKKDSIRAIVLHRFSVYPVEKMPPDLRNFYEQLKNGK